MDDPLQSVEDAADEDHEIHRHWFPIIDVGEFVGWEEELDGRLFDHILCLRSQIVLTASKYSDLASMGPVRLCVLKVSFQVFSYPLRSSHVAM